MSPGRRNSGSPSIITRPSPAMARPMRTSVLPIPTPPRSPWRKHEIGQALEEPACPVHGVKAFRLTFGQTDEPHGTNLESFSFDALNNRTREVPFDCIRLYDGQRPLGHRAIIA